MIFGAQFSGDGKYRHWLERRGISAEGEGCVTFVMLNPSTADHRKNDPTLVRCINFAISWGYSSLAVVNLFDWIATDPKELPKQVSTSSSPYNDEAILNAAKGSVRVVCAWGAYPHLQGRDQTVLHLLKEAGHTPRALALTKGGQPRHPLYLPSNSRPSILL